MKPNLYELAMAELHCEQTEMEDWVQANLIRDIIDEPDEVTWVEQWWIEDEPDTNEGK